MISIIVSIIGYNLRHINSFQESLVPNPPAISDTISSPSSSDSKLLQFSTQSKIDYNAIDNTIDDLTYKYKELKSIADNIAFKQTHVTTTNPNEPPTVNVGGSFPANITLNFSFPPPKIGETGPQGITGKQGPTGKTGLTGIQGIQGYYKRD